MVRKCLIHVFVFVLVFVQVNGVNVVKVGHKQVVSLIRQGGNRLLMKVVSVTRKPESEEVIRKKGKDWYFCNTNCPFTYLPFFKNLAQLQLNLLISMSNNLIEHGPLIMLKWFHYMFRGFSSAHVISHIILFAYGLSNCK